MRLLTATLTAMTCISIGVFCMNAMLHAENEREDPKLEADLPEGFPQPGPLNEIAIKQYPAYRLAQAEGDVFWPLFQHIKRNKIDMTAPVEFDLKQDERFSDDPLEIKTTAFLYGSQDLGELGLEKDSNIKVIDVEAMTVVSYAFTGDPKKSRLDKIREKIENYLKEHEEYARSGDYRLFAYHSPMVPRDKRWHELQLPVRKMTTEAEATKETKQEEKDKNMATKEIVLAGGCFWCTEAVFENVKGVKDVISGYAGGDEKTANYQAVSTGKTGHAEAIKITYDPDTVDLDEIFRIFFTIAHDPTQLNRQGPDTGTQYRSAVFYGDEDQKKATEVYIKKLTDSKKFDKPIVTTVEKLDAFYDAEDYHQDYARLNPTQPYIQFQAIPKLKKLKDDPAAKKE